MIKPSPQQDEAEGVWVTAIGLNKWVRDDLNILQDISLAFQPNEFIVVVGQSGGGKTTLVDALSGYRPATGGQVFVNHVDVYKNFTTVRNLIGYVPQRDIIHMELTVYQALDYAAKLRMPRRTTKEERHERVMEILDELDLTHRKDVQVSGLSGGQQKRVSIGVELLTRPKLFFLDEPTSGLDPGTETALMYLMRRLADQGRTIIMITHATKNVMLADKVVFLSRGGYLAWFGPPKEALKYFDQYRSESERGAKPMEFDDIYAVLDDSRKGTPQEWAERYKQHDAYQRNILEYLKLHEQADKVKSTLRSKILQAKESYLTQIPPIRQFFILSARNLKILARDRASLILMLFAPPIVGSLDLLIAPMMGRNLYDYVEGAPAGAAQTLFLLTLYTLMVSSLSQMREIVKEAEIYKRERLVNLRIVPYIGSKVWLAALLALYHAAAYTLIRYQAFKMPGGDAEFWMIYVTVFLAAFAGMMLGMLASALSPNASTAPMITILMIIPNIVLSGALVTLPAFASTPSSSYWAFKAFVGITGVGSDVAADDCWQFPEELRGEMTLDDKVALDCRCMGINLFDPDSCNFPGTGGRYAPEINQDAPQEPSSLGDSPVEPVLPPPPGEPADAYDKVAVAAYLTSIQDYQEEVARIQNDYKKDIEDYKTLSEIYQAQMVAYQSELSRWYIARSSAIGAAEGSVSAIRDRFGWAFVNKSDPDEFWPTLTTTWKAQLAIILVLFVSILILMKRKDSRQ